MYCLCITTKWKHCCARPKRKLQKFSSSLCCCYFDYFGFRFGNSYVWVAFFSLFTFAIDSGLCVTLELVRIHSHKNVGQMCLTVKAFKNFRSFCSSFFLVCFVFVGVRSFLSFICNFKFYFGLTVFLRSNT